MRFAPSPTGFLHVGGARTALFNWLFARHHRGTFILRIEDTDAARFAPEFVRGIYSALHWLGIDWDEGPDVGGEYRPYVQSERTALHRQAAERLASDGRAYECFCAREPDRAAAGADDETDSAPCACMSLPAAERARLRKSGATPALRFHVDPEREIVVSDVIRGEVIFPAGSVPDFVIVKGDGSPLYNFAAAIDDHTMDISHVIRGDEHLANTPKQLLIYEALGWTPPMMAHIPIILNEQRRKLSKRDGAAFVNDYEAQGILPEAMVNFLGLLGWSPKDDRELMTLDEMVHAFRLEDVVKHPAIFDHAKLAWVNKEYLKKLTPAQAAEKVLALLPARLPNATRVERGYVEKVAGLLLERVRTLAELVDLGSYFFVDGPVQPAPDALEKYCTTPDTVSLLSSARTALAAAPGFSATDVESALRGLAASSGRKAADYIHPLRVALTGVAVSPGIFEVASILGRDTVLARIDALIGRLSEGFIAPARTGET